MSWMIQTAIEGLAQLIADRVPAFNNNVKAFHAEREENSLYPYCTVDVVSWELQQEFNDTDIVDNSSGPDFIVHEDGLAVINAQIIIGASHKANILDLSEQVISALMPQPGADYVIEQTGVFFDIIEKTSGVSAKVRVETGSLSFEYTQVASDRWEATCTIVVSTPWLRIFQNPDNPDMEMQCVIDWTYTIGG